MKICSFASALVVAGWLAGMAGLASAAASEVPQGEPFIMRLLGKDPSKRKVSACFVRVYDADHLAKHPKQKVGAMMLLISGEPDTESKSVSYSFRLGITFRDRSTRFQSAGNCNNAKPIDADGKESGPVRFGCSVDCDGGGFGLTLSDDNKSALLKVDDRISIWRKNGDSEPQDSLEADAEDREFRLDRTSLADCVPLAEDRKEAADLRRGN
ncbi:MAG: hypothetical protein JO366_00680 [Methylobacteriaceae bacterium]|nr:hypothetical protein [Methylobacteriaceae bacterium]MBV9243308.1 hypothetical protein [Methylobacteriaceae bacterium]